MDNTVKRIYSPNGQTHIVSESQNLRLEVAAKSVVGYSVNCIRPYGKRNTFLGALR